MLHVTLRVTSDKSSSQVLDLPGAGLQLWLHWPTSDALLLAHVLLGLELNDIRWVAGGSIGGPRMNPMQQLHDGQGPDG